MRYLSGVATLKLTSDKCTGCGLCTEVCPHGVIEMKDGLASVRDLDLCMECGACMSNCEFGAIIVESGVGCAAALINAMLTGGPPSCGCSPDDGVSSCC